MLLDKPLWDVPPVFKNHHSPSMAPVDTTAWAQNREVVHKSTTIRNISQSIGSIDLVAPCRRKMILINYEVVLFCKILSFWAGCGIVLRPGSSLATSFVCLFPAD
jgi:hypothetical protein